MTTGERLFSNPGRKNERLSRQPYVTIADLRVEPIVTEYFGVQMVWRSRTHGVIATFPWWDNLERNPRIADPDWWPVGNEVDHYFDADQDWVFESWADDDFVYVLEGLDIESYERRYKVPRLVFLDAWREGARRIKATVPPTQTDNHGGTSRP